MIEKKKTKKTKKTTAKKKPKKVVGVKVEKVVIKEEVVSVKVLQKEVPVSQAKIVDFIPKEKKASPPKGIKYYGTGRRKEAVAKVWLSPGKGDFAINGKSLLQYFCGRKLLEFQALRPLVVTNTQGSYDVFVEAFGGGVPGQAVAVSLGIARALLVVSPDFRVKLKREGLLRRDPRMKERKKYGLKRARRAFQYTKR
ncbi:MAG: 30S ribosomal protein S9 [Candidatus Saganbacteria bacterium]|nr:30S ribosomal protein S9 [Candidatus Saganbacteria bacterium]